jgi:hypothetical protein
MVIMETKYLHIMYSMTAILNIFLFSQPNAVPSIITLRHDKKRHICSGTASANKFSLVGGDSQPHILRVLVGGNTIGDALDSSPRELHGICPEFNNLSLD